MTAIIHNMTQTQVALEILVSLQSKIENKDLDVVRQEMADRVKQIQPEVLKVFSPANP